MRTGNKHRVTLAQAFPWSPPPGLLPLLKADLPVLAFLLASLSLVATGRRQRLCLQEKLSTAHKESGRLRALHRAGREQSPRCRGAGESGQRAQNLIQCMQFTE